RRFLGSWIFRRVADHHPTALAAGHCAPDHDQATLDIDLCHFQILRGDAVDAVMAVHLLVLERPARILASAGTAQRAMRNRNAVTGFEAPKIPALHRAGEATADGDTRHVDLLAGYEVIGKNHIADIEQVFGIDAEFRQLLLRLDFRLGELPTLGLVDILGFRKARTELNGGIAV